jgi:hypothetical protein
MQHMDPLYIVIMLLGIALFVLAVWVFTLERRIEKLLSGKNGASLEDAIGKNQSDIAALFSFKNDALGALREIDDRIRKKLHGAKTLRFNPFAGTGSGGNQSFATALLDENGDGVVLSTLYSREKVSVFAKPIKHRTSEIELTEVLK